MRFSDVFVSDGVVYAILIFAGMALILRRHTLKMIKIKGITAEFEPLRHVNVVERQSDLDSEDLNH